ncbi:MAG: TonB-dependent receptor domain-containing protein, partial [Blastocatellia bacterium]
QRTFFFVDYQGTRIRQAQTDVSTVPTLAERGGDFSDLQFPIFDPLTTNPVTGVRTAFPNNVIPACSGTTGRSASGGSCLDPAALNVVNLFPAPNIPGAGSANNFLFNPNLKNNQDSFDIRVDHEVSTHNSLSVNFDYGTVDAVRPDPFPGNAGGGLFSGNISNKSLAAGISDLYSFSDNKINELKIGYMRYVVAATPFFEGQALAQQLGIPGINDPNNLTITGGLPNIGISGLSNLGNQDFFPEFLHENNYQILDSFTYLHGRHAFKMGVDLKRKKHGFFQTQNPRGDLFFDGQFTEDLNNTSANPGSPLASFLIGNPISAFRDGQKGNFGMSWWEISAYFMDDFRVSPKLTLNLGLRYDIFTPEVEEHNRLANFDFATGQFVEAGMPGVSRSGNVVTNLHNFAPRIGFAYTPFDDNKTVLRGGFGIFYDLQANQNDAELAFNPTGLFGSQSIQSAPSAIPPMRLSTGFPNALPFPTLADPSGRASAAFFNNPTTYIEEWNLNVERQLAKDTVLQVAYVGTHGVDLTFLRNLNQPVQPLDSNFEVCPVPTDPSCLTGL